MSQTVSVILVILIAASAASAAAQTANSFEQLALLVESGDSVTVTASGGREHAGRIIDISASAVALLIDGERHDFDEGHVDAVHQWRRDDPILGGMLFGMGIGAGIAMRGFFGDYDLSKVWTLFGVLAGAGAGIGAGVDALVPGRQLIYRSAGSGRRVAVTPLLASNRRGVAVSFGF